MLKIQTIATLLAAAFLCARTCSAQQDDPDHGHPTSGGYKPPALSLEPFAISDPTIIDPLMTFARSGDAATYRATIQTEANSGNIRAELVLAEQHIPDQCPFQPNLDVPNCTGPNGEHFPSLNLPKPLGFTPSYEEAANWLERASAHGSGEASEMLAQLITRMLANGHPTKYTAADSTRLHALARSQGFDVESIVLSVFQLSPGTSSLTLGGPQSPPIAGTQSFSKNELRELEASGIRGTLHFKGSNGTSDSVLLARPEGPAVHIRVILDHVPQQEIHLPIPAHRDVIYVQRGDSFVAFPSGLPSLPRFLSIMPDPSDKLLVCARSQNIFGEYAGICTIP